MRPIQICNSSLPPPSSFFPSSSTLSLTKTWIKQSTPQLQRNGAHKYAIHKCVRCSKVHVTATIPLSSLTDSLQILRATALGVLMSRMHGSAGFELSRPGLIRVPECVIEFVEAAFRVRNGSKRRMCVRHLGAPDASRSVARPRGSRSSRERSGVSG